MPRAALCHDAIDNSSEWSNDGGRMCGQCDERVAHVRDDSLSNSNNWSRNLLGGT